MASYFLNCIDKFLFCLYYNVKKGVIIMQQNIYNDSMDELNEDLNIDYKNIFMLIWHRKYTIISVFCSILIFFILLTFVLPKKYEVTADLYVNKTNNSNISEINPFVIDEVGGGGMISMGSDKAINNEIELMQSPLVIDKVIRENNLKYKKLFGIIKTKKTGEYLTTESFLKKGKNLPIENRKNTNVITISYKSKDPKLSYNVISSVINNYIELHKEINSCKSKSDKKIIEKEYNRVKGELNKSMNGAGGLPSGAISGTGNLAAMSAFSRTASQAMGNIQGQYIFGEKSKVEISEKAAKVNSLSQKLEWAKLVEDMSDSSKVLVLKEPRKLRDYEYTSPKLFINIMLGIIFGVITSFFALILKEVTDKKVSYSQLCKNIIYNDNKALFNINKFLFDYKNRNISCILFEEPEQNISELLSKFKNINIVKAEISTSLYDSIDKSDSSILICRIGKTDSELYKSIKETLKIHNKQILKEILI